MISSKFEIGEGQGRLGEKSGGSGLSAWLLAREIDHRRDEDQPLLMIERMELFPSSGEICRRVESPLAVLKRIKTLHAGAALEIDEAEGLRLVFKEWRCKFRVSPTASVLCLSVESRGEVALMRAKTNELLDQIEMKD